MMKDDKLALILCNNRKRSEQHCMIWKRYS